MTVFCDTLQFRAFPIPTALSHQLVYTCETRCNHPGKKTTQLPNCAQGHHQKETTCMVSAAKTVLEQGAVRCGRAVSGPEALCTGLSLTHPVVVSAL